MQGLLAEEKTLESARLLSERTEVRGGFQPAELLIVSQQPGAIKEIHARLSAAGFGRVRDTDETVDAIDILRSEGRHVLIVDEDFGGRMMIVATLRGEDELRCWPVITFAVADSRATNSNLPERSPGGRSGKRR